MHGFVRSIVPIIGLVLASFTSVTMAQYPQKPISLVIPFPAGGPTDTAIGAMLPSLSAALGQKVQLDHKPGSHGAPAVEYVAKSAPDGYTLLAGNSSPLVAVPLLRKNPPYDPVRDLAPIVFLGWTPLLLVVTPDVPAKSLRELIQYARTNPGKLTVAAANPPTIFTFALIRSREKVDIASNTYPIDAAAMKALLDGRAQVMAAGMNIGLRLVQEGKLRPLATLGANRSRMAPEIPTMNEAGIADFAIYPWVAIFAPAGTPPAIIERMSREVNAALKRPEVQAGLDKAAFDYKGSTPQELGQILKSQLGVWGAVARDAGLEPQ